MRDWIELVRGARGISCEVDRIGVEFQSGRRQWIEVEASEERFSFRGVAARGGGVPVDGSAEHLACSANRTTLLVGFRIDAKGRFVGESWVPRAGLTSEEFLFVLRHVAAECDRIEYVLTGEDRE